MTTLFSLSLRVFHWGEMKGIGRIPSIDFKDGHGLGTNEAGRY
jgi:hypothetical protein